MGPQIMSDCFGVWESILCVRENHDTCFHPKGSANGGASMIFAYQIQFSTVHTYLREFYFPYPVYPFEG